MSRFGALKARKTVAGLILSAIAATVAVAASPAYAGTIVADTGAGTAPTAFVPVTVGAQSFQGPGANSIDLAPINLIIDASNDYTAPALVGLDMTFSGAQFDQSDSHLTLSVAQRNSDGTMGAFQAASFVDSLLLTNRLIVDFIQGPWSFLEITGLVFTQAADLATPGATIGVSVGELYNSNNSVQEFEPITPAVLVSSQDVPAPGALALLALGLAGCVAVRRAKPKLQAVFA